MVKKKNVLIRGETIESGNLSMYVEFSSYTGKAIEIDNKYTIENYMKIVNPDIKLAHQRVIRAEKPIIDMGTRTTETLILANSDVYPDRIEYTEEELSILAGKDCSINAFLNESLLGKLLRTVHQNLEIRYPISEVSLQKNGYATVDLTWDTVLDTPEFYTLVGYNIRNNKFWTTLIKQEKKPAVEEDIIPWQWPGVLDTNEYVSIWELSIWAWNIFLLNQLRLEKSIIEKPFF